ncbi:O-antigen ligase family protein [Acinetobacter sp. c1-l78]|uniref:O-antigen ligase family protein n=1 Tax=Acinetobacter sp. c1-l78 TaxID=3342803 RepID=UPI0035B85A62
MTYTLGFGLPVSSDYGEFLYVTGTFTNPNDLACIVMLSSFCIAKIEQEFPSRNMAFIWLIIALLLLITSSRTALLATFLIFLATRIEFFTLKAIKKIIISLVVCIPVVTIAFHSDISVVTRIVDKLDTIIGVYNNGVGFDHSSSLRIESYMYFLKNIGNLGLGSGEIYNYYKYSTYASFETELMFYNPHSLIVELGYWLGWIGLSFFMVAFVYTMYEYQRNILLVLIISITSMNISSSVLSSFYYFLLLFLCLLVGSPKIFAWVTRFKVF